MTVPAPEQPSESEGRYETPPSFPPDSLKPWSAPNIPSILSRSTTDVAAANISDVDALRDRLVAAEDLLEQWRAAASSLLAAVALSPDLTIGLYAKLLRSVLAGAVADLADVQAVRHVHASLPAVPAEAPAVDLRLWHGLSLSEWNIDWAPSSWWVSLAADGARWGLAVSARVRVSNIHVRGVMRTAFSSDLSAVRVSFATPPELRMDVDTSVEWGVVPVPVQESIDEMVRQQVASFIERRLSGEGMVIVLRRKNDSQMSESDVLEATQLARSAGSLKLSPSTFL